MTILLLVIIYIAFISLGIPDSLFGTAWPAINMEFGLPISSAGYVTMTISGCTILSSLVSAKVIQKLGTGPVTAFSVLMTAAALWGFSVSPNIVWLCLFAVPLGLGAGSVDTALNNYVALHYKASHMNLLHCFYGIGVTLSPYLMSLALSHQNNWRKGYWVVFIIQGIIALITLISLPLWKKTHPNKEESQIEEQKIVGIVELIKLPAVKAVSLFFICSCAIEFTAGTWGSTYLVNSKGFLIENAAQCVTLYYAGIAIGRFLSGLLVNKLSCWKLIFIGQGVIITAIVVLLAPLPMSASSFALFMMGLGVGPIFPNLIHLTPVNFGKEISQSIMGIQLASCYVGITFLPPLFGLLAQILHTGIFPYYLIALFSCMILATKQLVVSLKKEN